jgi:Holliday junction resolvasome RuvABC ATP-dependent DNA helicase subunit
MSILSGGPQRVNVIGSLLGLPVRTISHVVEPFLIRVGFVMKDDQGRRQLTLAGHEHLSKPNPTLV